MKRSGKLTPREIANNLIREGEIIDIRNTTLTVRVFGHIYRIEDAETKKPRITEVTNE